MSDNKFNGEDLTTIIMSLAEEGRILELKGGNNVQITEEGFDTLMALLAIASLSAKDPINHQAKQLGETIGRELAQWRNRMN